MNTTRNSVDDLFAAARDPAPLLTDAETEDLLIAADRRRKIHVGAVILHFLGTFFNGYIGIATAALGVAVSMISTVLYVNEARSPVQSLCTVASVAEVTPTMPTEVSPAIPLHHYSHVAATFRERPAMAIETVTVSNEIEDATPLSTIRGIVVVRPVTQFSDADIDAVNSSCCASLVPTRAGLIAEDFSLTPGASLVIESGYGYSAFRGGFRNTVNASDITAPQNYAASQGEWTYHAAAGIALPISSWLRASGAIRVSQLATTYTSPDVMFVQSVAVPVKHSLALHLGEVAFEPALRVQPTGSSYFVDAGISLGMLYKQSAVYSTTATSSALPATALAAPLQTSTIGAGRMQCDVRVGVGSEIMVGSAMKLTAELRGEYGLVTLFADNYPRRLSVTPLIGMQFMVP